MFEKFIQEFVVDFLGNDVAGVFCRGVIGFMVCAIAVMMFFVWWLFGGGGRVGRGCRYRSFSF